ncbi:MAG TPA: hypothetical protein VLB76_26795 [Thermoanaerobaculia bacterium]|jgi:hypothetical protein|nr:hypothetical protein [Thermoanaerobaculia bacterium]
MDFFIGTLSFVDRNSFLMPQGFLLLRASVNDRRQAAVSATNLIRDVQHLKANQKVGIVGTKDLVGSIPAIRMTEINPVGAWGRTLSVTDLQPMSVADLEAEIVTPDAKLSSPKKTQSSKSKAKKSVAKKSARR